MQGASPVGRSRRFENIDALRGLAALLVVWHHASEVFASLPRVAARGTAWFDAAELLGAGRAGVIAFFAISGYVIVPTVRPPRRDGTIDFLIKRFFRLFPPFWMAMGVAAFSVWWLFDRGLTGSIVLANLTMFPLEFGQPQMMGHFWTLEVELIFYGLVLILFWCDALRHEAVIAWVALLLTIVWVVGFRNAAARSFLEHNSVWTFLSYFICVMFWGAMVRSRRQRSVDQPTAAWAWRSHAPFMLVTALVFGRPLLAIAFGSTTVNREDWRGTLLGLILFLIAIRFPSRWASPFAWTGTISYSIYLLHPAVFGALLYVVLRHDALADAPLSIYILATVIASMLCAALAYRCVERPSNALGRLWVSKRAARLRGDGQRAPAKQVVHGWVDEGT